MENTSHISYSEESNSEQREYAEKLQGLRNTVNNKDYVSEAFIDIVESHCVALGDEIHNRMYKGYW